ncbi:MAG: lasso peptide biosynthesis B2 protein [Rhizomicrobium sp.]
MPPALRRNWFGRTYRRFHRLPFSRRALALEAVLWLALARVALLLVPFRVLAGRFGHVTSPDAPPAERPMASDTHMLVAREIGWAVTRSARYAPFRAVCLPQAIAAKAMLDRRGIGSVMHFGVAKSTDGGPLKAHAWLDGAGVEVTGFPLEPGFVEVARFV